MLQQYQSYFLNGHVLHTQLPLPAAPAATGLVGTEIRIDRASATIPQIVPAGVLLAEYRRGEFGHAVVRQGNRYVLRLFGMCDFLIDRELRFVDVCPKDGLPDDLLVTLCCGTLVSALAILSGNWPLHASAVRLPTEQGLAFVGGSGAGKTTLAAACCTLGAELITDDVLVTDVHSSGRLNCYSGATELRLRPNALDLEKLAITWAARTTADGRTAVSPKPHPSDSIPLHALVVPVRNGAPFIRITQFSSTEAILELTKYPRLAGWSEAGAIERRFRRLSAIVRSATVWKLEMPLGSPTQAIQELIQQVF